MEPKTPPLCSRRQFGRLTLGTLASAAPLGAGFIHTDRTSNEKDPRPSATPRPPIITRRAREPDDQGDAFLKDQARRIIDSACLRAGQTAGAFRNSTPCDLHVPGGNMGYPAFWVRDAVMMLGGDFITAAELEGWIRLIASTLRGPADWGVRPGVVVPAYAVPDHINFDGKPTFYPGNYETGDRQGGDPWGKYPPLDDHFYFVTAVHEHWRLTNDLGLFRATVRTSFGEEPLADLCEKAYRVPPSDPTTALVTAGDVERENAKDWGFCDSVFKSGKLLFPSLLKLIAARQLAALFETADERTKAARYRDDVHRITNALAPTFQRPSADDAEGWLHSATEIGDQPDVWGSALAVHSGALDPPDAARVSRALARAFRERTAVRDGFVRHVPTTDPLNHGAWQKSVSADGEYQNGGHWGTPTGWYISAVHKTDPQAAGDLAKEYLQNLRRNLRPDGMTQAWEWCNPDTGKSANPLYVATVALPYLSLKEAGLLNLLRSA